MDRGKGLRPHGAGKDDENRPTADSRIAGGALTKKGARAAGRKARDDKKFITDVPSGYDHAPSLASEWKKGWTERAKEQVKLPPPNPFYAGSGEGAATLAKADAFRKGMIHVPEVGNVRTPQVPEPRTRGEIIWPEGKPFPPVFEAPHRAPPYPCENEKCRLVKLASGLQAVIVEATEVAKPGGRAMVHLFCRGCGNRWKKPRATAEQENEMRAARARENAPLPPKADS